MADQSLIIDFETESPKSKDNYIEKAQAHHFPDDYQQKMGSTAILNSIKNYLGAIIDFNVLL